MPITTAPQPSPTRASAPSSSGDILVASGVEKTYRTGDQHVRALRGLDLRVGAGEFLTVMGPSGHGKTTLLNCLSGLDTIDSGTVTVDGESIHEMSDAARTAHRAQRMGFIFQSFNLIPVLSAVENVELPLLAIGGKGRAAREQAMHLLDRVGLAHRAGHRPAELSGGEQQRVATARALVTQPALIWADEPTGNLDSATAASILELLHEVHAAGQTLVVVTHDEGLGRSGDRLVHIVDGVAARSERLSGAGGNDTERLSGAGGNDTERLSGAGGIEGVLR